MEVSYRPSSRRLEPSAVKAVFIDADGTLVSFRTHRPVPSALEAIAELRRRGIYVCLATGRSVDALQDLASLPLDGFVCSSGQFCLDAGGRLLRQQTLDPADIKGLLDLLDARRAKGLEPYDVCFIGPEETLFNHISPPTADLCRELNFALYPVAPPETLRGGSYLQLMYFGGPQGQADIMRVMPRSQATRWHDGFIDIMPLDGGKAFGLETLCAHLGISPSETVAIGDGENDIPMLRAAGLGVAMGSATAAAKAAADVVTADTDRDGICKALSFLGLLA